MEHKSKLGPLHFEGAPEETLKFEFNLNDIDLEYFRDFQVREYPLVIEIVEK